MVGRLPYPIRWLVVVLALTGCAGREVSSTDHHNRILQVSCYNVPYDHMVRTMCCDGERCWLIQ